MTTQAQRAITWLRVQAKPDAPLYAVLSFMVLVGLVLRVWPVDNAGVLRWDEHHYVLTARSYLHGEYAWNDHPPLSKLIIAGFMAVLGDRPLAWRLPSLLFGLANIGLVWWTTLTVFASRRAAFLAAACVAADGFFIAYSRTALLDGMIVAFGLAGITRVLTARNAWHMLFAGLSLGCAMGCKLNSLAFLGTAVMAALLSQPLRRYVPILLAGAVGVFYAQEAFTLWLTGKPFGPWAVVMENRAMMQHHLSYTEVHPMSSHWYTWFLPTRPIFLRHDADVSGTLRVLLTLGNPLLWWGSSAAVVATIVTLARTGPKELWHQVRSLPSSFDEPPVVVPRHGLMLLALAAWAAPVAFWIPSLRDSYIYHYMPSYAFALVLLAGVADRLYARHRFEVLLAVLVVALVTVFYAPLWAELPLSQEALNVRLLFKSWH